MLLLQLVFLARAIDQYGVSISLQAAVVDLTYREMGNSGPLIVAKPICLLAEPTGHRPCSTNCDLGLGFFDAD
jgi:hypothetical protein